MPVRVLIVHPSRSLITTRTYAPRILVDLEDLSRLDADYSSDTRYLALIRDPYLARKYSAYTYISGRIH